MLVRFKNFDKFIVLMHIITKIMIIKNLFSMKKGTIICVKTKEKIIDQSVRTKKEKER